MRFSIYLNPQTRGAEEDVPIIESIAAQAVRATRAGVQGIALTEHHFSGYNTYGNNFMLASYLASQVPADTMFLLAVAVPTLHNPLRLAQSCQPARHPHPGEPDRRLRGGRIPGGVRRPGP